MLDELIFFAVWLGPSIVATAAIWWVTRRVRRPLLRFFVRAVLVPLVWWPSGVAGHGLMLFPAFVGVPFLLAEGKLWSEFRSALPHLATIGSLLFLTQWLLWRLRRRKASSSAAVAIAVVAFLLPAVGASDTPSEWTEEFASVARDGKLENGVALVQQLSDRVRQELAASVARHADPQVVLFGAGVFYELDDWESLVIVMAEAVASGNEELMKPIGWSLTHGDEDKGPLAQAVIFGLPRYLIVNLDKYEGERREAVMKTICQGDAGCDPQDVLQRLDRAEAELSRP